MTAEETHPRPDELEDRLDDLMEGGAEPPTASGTAVSTNPNESAAEHEPMAVADSDNEQDPGRDSAGGGS